MPLVRFFYAALEFFLEIVAALFTRLVFIGIMAVTAIYALDLWVGNVPPLMANLTGTLLRRPVPNPWQVFEQRVRSAFPEGTSDAEMASALVEQGFEIRPTVASDKLTRRASYVTYDILRCGWGWHISWRVDPAGNVAEVSTSSPGSNRIRFCIHGECREISRVTPCE